MKKKVAIEFLTSQGGGGHYATYNAIRSVIEQQQLPWQLNVTDMDDLVASLAEKQSIVNIYELFGISSHDLYNLMLKSGWTWLFPLMFRLNKLLIKLNYDFGLKFFEQYWRERQPDLVVSIVAFYNKVAWESLEKVKPGTPYVTVPIDFEDLPPGSWMEPETDNYTICGTERAAQQACSLGIKPERIVKTSGMVIHPRFSEPINCDRKVERQRLGLAPDCLTGLVMFGGQGSKVMLDIAKRLECFQDQLQLIFICGLNEELVVALRNSPGLQKRFVTGFTQDMPYYMHLSDFFIGKPGPGSISEAIAMKLPVIVECNFATLIHERYNAKWVQLKEVGLVLRSFREIDRAVEEFLDPQKLARYRANVAAIDNRAVFEVVEFLKKIVPSSDKTTVAEAIELGQ
ncbi:UDP-N-acetylglucosamine:LPS N-acetylglucosamine transferase [Pleurocapsa sp. PCC 7327]|uniref:MGDG synthase family glycosyltransferase n=1 Tax=Pleurocapsa sp. PCC 7327 TaxID=118163 RepID=UPI00029FB98B|nr:glycosyltransferase [Pleurocapsa sp. PCC 7327]AFY75723.1 UDP-N-acetylglucosamine:LPS N-acetylglucosamine transferase [Pleurocapsa sp. PCC 7327]